MPEVWLTGREAHTEFAMQILSEALLARAPKKVTVTHANTADCASQQLNAKYLTFENVSIAGSSNYITLAPRQGIEINIRTLPLLHHSADKGEPEVHTAHIDRHGDFLYITHPYYFYADEHEVSYSKWCMFLNLPKRRGE